jgi:hypothetical protein
MQTFLKYLLLALSSSAMGDILFQTLGKFALSSHIPLTSHLIVLCIVSEKWHGKEKSWGRFLDAGTGVGSLKWAQQQITTTSITAITADVQMQRQVISEPSVNMSLRPQDQILVGNWMDDLFWLVFVAVNAIVQ